MEDKVWFLYVVDHHEGPFTADEIQKLVKDGKAKTSSYVWKEGYGDWIMMSDVPDFGGQAPGTDGHGQPAFVVEGSGAGTSVNPGPDSPAFIASQLPDLGDSGDAVWCLNHRNTYSGPHSIKALIRMLNSGQASPQDTIWKEGWTTFTQISEISQIMSEVKPAKEKGSKEKKTFGAAEILGIGADPTKTVGRRSPILIVGAVLLALGVLYELVAVGTLDSALDLVGVKQKVKSLQLPALPLPSLPSINTNALDGLKPMMKSIGAKLPEPMKGWLTGLELPNTLSADDAQNLQAAALEPISSGARIAAAIPVGDELNPAFTIATNLPDGTSLTVILRGKPRMLLNAGSYERIYTVDVQGNIAQSPRFSFEGTKPLPKGEYVLVVYDSEKQTPESKAQLQALPKKSPPGIPAGRVAFSNDTYFLGGKRDQVFTQRLKEYNDRIDTRRNLELNELRQTTLTLEAMANESATKFFGLIRGKPGPQRKKAWNQYHSRYLKLSSQLKSATTKTDPQRVFAGEYRLLANVYQLTETLHLAETQFIERGRDLDSVKTLAGKTLEGITQLKQALSKAGK